ELYKQVQAADRLTAIKVNGADSALDIAINAAAALLKNGAVAVIGSGRSTVEEQFLTKKLAAALNAPVSLVSRVGEGDKLLLSADRNPNVRGALVTGLISALPSQKLAGLAADIDAGKIKTVISIGEDLTAAGLTAAQLAKVAIVYLGTHANATSAAAQVLIPTITVFEKSGSLVNQQFRLQKLQKAIPGAAGTTDDLVALAKLIGAVGGGEIAAEINTLWNTLSAEVPALGATHFKRIPEGGLPLDSAPFAALPFVEGETLHYKPAAATA
ncbi:MAG: ferredoxin, partial [Opitutaceae bacterium]|nr:ferredoxin [Opitutaceae bacterium]